MEKEQIQSHSREVNDADGKVIKSLGYVNEFKEFVRENPGFFSTAKKLIESFDPKKDYSGQVYEDDGVAVEFIADRGRTYHYKVTYKDKSFFIKIANPIRFQESESGRAEFDASREARKRLEKIDWAEIVDYQLGYTDKITNRKYFISRYIEHLEQLDSYIYSLRDSPLEEDIQKRIGLRSKVRELNTILEGFFDVFAPNMFYDEEHDKIILFDLFKDSDVRSQNKG